MEMEINVLDELNKGSCMGVDAINFILDKYHYHSHQHKY